jgi:hypothetical protein
MTLDTYGHLFLRGNDPRRAGVVVVSAAGVTRNPV